MLNVEKYNQEEEAARLRLPNRVVEAAGCAHFALQGYPTEAKSNAHVGLYIDAMHELGAEKDYNEILKGFTAEEFDLFKKISSSVVNLSNREYGCRIAANGALIRAFIGFRYIRSLLPEGKGLILEVGPGSGYLGALLALSNYTYLATDNTQGFYMAQNHLWSELFGERLIELASDTRDLSDFEVVPEGAVIHIPWWKFYVERPTELSLKVDMLTVNHALCEMHRSAFGYVVNLSYKLLDKMDGFPHYFFIEGPGADRLRDQQTMCSHILSAGHVNVYTNGNTDIFAPDNIAGTMLWENPSDVESVNSSTDQEINTKGQGLGSYINRIFGSTVFKLYSKISSALFPGGFRSQDETLEPSEEIKSNPIPSIAECQVNEYFRKLESEDRVPYSEIIQYLGSLVGEENIVGRDEAFLKFVYGSDNWG